MKYLSLLLFCIPFHLSAQEKIYLDIEHNVTEQDKAIYYRVNESRDTAFISATYWVSGETAIETQYKSKKFKARSGVHRRYYQDGTIKQKSAYRNNKLVDLSTYYHDDGSLKEERKHFEDADDMILTFRSKEGKHEVINGNGIYIHRITNEEEDNPFTCYGAIEQGKRNGVWEYHDLNGVLRFREEYKAGKLVKGFRFDGSTKVKYKVSSSQPIVIGGMKELYREVHYNLTYPEDARKRGAEGKVFVQFVVNKDGSMSEFQTVNDVDPLLSFEAVSTLRKLKARWEPGVIRGKKVRVKMILPITFKL